MIFFLIYFLEICLFRSSAAIGDPREGVEELGSRSKGDSVGSGGRASVGKNRIERYSVGKGAVDTVVLATDLRGAADPVVVEDGVEVSGLMPVLVPDLGRLGSGPIAGALATSSTAGNVGSEVQIFLEDLLVLPGAGVVSVRPHTAVGLGQLLHPRVDHQ